MKAVIFDLGNVLVKYDWEGYLRGFGFEEDTYQKAARAMFLNKTWVQGDEGIYNEETWLQAFIENAPECENEIRKVYETLGGCIYRFDYTMELIRHFREEGYQIYYLSNYSEYLRKASGDSLSFIEEFDGGVFSYEEKCLKPDEKIYKILLERYKIDPADALFLDDREENIEAARKLGMSGIVWTPECVKEFLK